jgi:hypothetical protein
MPMIRGVIGWAMPGQIDDLVDTSGATNWDYLSDGPHRDRDRGERPS